MVLIRHVNYVNSTIDPVVKVAVRLCVSFNLSLQSPGGRSQEIDCKF